MKIKNMAYWKTKNNTPLKKEMGPYESFDVDKDIVEKNEHKLNKDKTEKKYNWTVVDARPQEVIDKEKEEIAKEEELKKKEQEKIQQQIEGTYVETEEDIKKRKEKWNDLYKK